MVNGSKPPVGKAFIDGLDPRICNIALDANALDKDGSARDHLVDRFNALVSEHRLTVVISSGVRGEVEHPHTPAIVKDSILPRFFNLETELAASQKTERQRVAAVLQGNADPGKHAEDAAHLSQAAETGCGYFITHDKRILDKRGQLQEVLRRSLAIVTLREFFEAFDYFEVERHR